MTPSPVKIPIAIVGCGGMGGRHLLGLKELSGSSLCNVELAAVCDLRRDNAAYVADEAAALLGKRPQVFQDLEAMVKAVPDLQAAIITTDVAAHHVVATAAFDLGLHVLCEKPLGLTMRACNRILDAQQRSGKLLSVGENYRRDPMSRLSQALLEEAEVIGAPHLFLDISASSGNRIVITPWRHLKYRGGMLLDGGVHNADMMLYLMGDIEQIYGQITLREKIRYNTREGAVSGFYERWAGEIPDAIEATAEDTLASVITFDSGATGQWTQSYAAHGRGFGHKVIYGSLGSLIPGGIRNGISPVLHLDDREPLSGEALLELAPDFHLDAITSDLFGSARMASYTMPFPDADRKLLAIEIHELAQCILDGTTPEVDGYVGRRAVALCYAAFESSNQNRPLMLEEIESEELDSYEAEINAYYAL